jgi:hypothetical protein
MPIKAEAINTFPLSAIDRKTILGTECELQKLVCAFPHKMQTDGFAFSLALDLIRLTFFLSSIMSVPSGISISFAIFPLPKNKNHNRLILTRL